MIWWRWMTLCKRWRSTIARKCQIVELRFFGGLTVNETAEVLRLSPITIIREWNKAKAWLYQELNPERERWSLSGGDR